MAEDEGSDDESQKTEDPTPRRLEEAKKRGQVVQSREVNNWMVLLAITLFISTSSSNMLAEIRDIFRNFIEQSYAFPTDNTGLGQVVSDLFISVGKIALIPIAVIAVIGALSSFVQSGPLFTLDPITPDMSKISVLKGFERLFSARSLVEFAKGIIKIAIVSAIMYFAVSPYFYGVEHFVGQDVGSAMFDMYTIIIKILISVLSILFFLAVGDYLYQRHEFMKKMRMTLQEVKEEYKQTEGDPLVKGKLKQLRAQKARQRMMQNVPKADVVITNPTHYAIALKYDMEEMQAPVMLAKGADKVAERIKEIARENKIPIVENAPLARALFSSMEIDEMIPKEHFKAVAEVISYVFKLKGKKA